MATTWENMNLYERFVNQRQRDMETDKDLYKGMRDKVVEYVRPDLTTNNDSTRGKQAGTSIIEGTAHFDAAVMAKWFVGNLVGAALDWIRYRMGDRRLRGNDLFNAWLQRFSEFMLEDVYAYPHSNFYEVNGDFVLDGLTIGSPVMLTNRDYQNQRTVCTIPHFSENFLMRDWFGDDVAYHRKWKVRNFCAMQAFGKDNLPASIQYEVRNGNYTTEHEYLMCIARAGDSIFQDLKPEYAIPLQRPWLVLWFAKDGVSYEEQCPLNYKYLKLNNSEAFVRAKDGSKVQVPISSPGTYHKPFNAWHYHRLPQETYARTPAWSALPDIKGLNAAWKSVHEMAHNAATPAVLAVESLKGKLKLGAKGETYIPDEKWDQRPEAFDTKSNYTWAMDFIDRRTKTVGRHFYADMARMIENYSRDHKQPPTAYQLSQMISETLVLIGPAITSYAGPALQNIDEQFIEIEAEGSIPNDPTTSRLWRQTEPPQEIIAAGGNVMPLFTGPLVQGLRLAMRSKHIVEPLTMAAPIFELDPDSKMTVRWPDLVEIILEGGDFPQGVIVPKEEREKMMEALTEERRQMNMLQKMSVMADMVPKMQGSTQADSPLKVFEEAP